MVHVPVPNLVIPLEQVAVAVVVVTLPAEAAPTVGASVQLEEALQVVTYAE